MSRTSKARDPKTRFAIKIAMSSDLTVCWQYADHWSGDLAFWISGSNRLELPALQESFESELQVPQNAKRKVTMWVQYKGSEETKLEPVELEKAMETLVKNLLAPEWRPESHKAVIAQRLWQHGFLHFEPQGHLRFCHYHLIIKQKSDGGRQERYEVWEEAKMKEKAKQAVETLKDQHRIEGGECRVTASACQVYKVSQSKATVVATLPNSTLQIVEFDECALPAVLDVSEAGLSNHPALTYCDNPNMCLESFRNMRKLESYPQAFFDCHAVSHEVRMTPSTPVTFADEGRQEPFYVQLMHPGERVRCFEYLHFAADTWLESWC